MIGMVVRCDFCQITTGLLYGISTKREALKAARELGFTTNDGKDYCQLCTSRRAKLAKKAKSK